MSQEKTTHGKLKSALLDAEEAHRISVAKLTQELGVMSARSETAERLPRPRRAASMASAARGRRRAVGLRKLPQALLGPHAEAPWAAGRHAPQRAPQLHLDAAGAGRRGRPGRQARRPQERGRDVESLHPRHARRRGRGQGARSSLRSGRAMKGRATGNERADGRDRRVSHFMKAPVAVALLREQHGEAEARKIALTEQRRARQARSKKRFAFLGRGGALQSPSMSSTIGRARRPEATRQASTSVAGPKHCGTAITMAFFWPTRIRAACPG